MRDVVWLLLLFPWLATSSPTACPEPYAWDEATNDCIPCSVCIYYPKFSFCSACVRFIETPKKPSDSEVNLESSDVGVDQGDVLFTSRIAVAITTAGFVIGIMTCGAVFVSIRYMYTILLVNSKALGRNGPPSAALEASDSDRESPPSDDTFFPNGPSRAKKRNPLHYVPSRVFVPSDDSLANTETSERSSTPSLDSGNDQRFLIPKSSSRAGMRNSSHYVPGVPTDDSCINTVASERDTCSTSSPALDHGQRFGILLFRPLTAGERSSSQLIYGGESVPSDELYNSSVNTESSKGSSTPSIDSSTETSISPPSLSSDHDQRYLSNSSSGAWERNSLQYVHVHCGESVPSDELYNSRAHTEASERSRTPSDRKFPSPAEEGNSPQYILRPGESIPSQDLYNSCANTRPGCNTMIVSRDRRLPTTTTTETSERSSTHSLPSDHAQRLLPNSQSRAEEWNSLQHVHCGGSVPSHELYNSCQDATEPKLIQENEIITIESMQDTTASDNNDSENIEAREVHGTRTAHSVMSQDDQELMVMVVSIPGSEAEQFPD